MGCDCCKVDTPHVYEKCEKIQAFAEKYHKKKVSPCGQCTFVVRNPNFSQRKNVKRKQSNNIMKISWEVYGFAPCTFLYLNHEQN